MTEPPEVDPLVGRVLDGRYRIEEKLGEGGMGTVYRATHVLMEKPVAIKVLRAIYATDDMAVKRFQREARGASRLDHEHCIRVTDFGVTSDSILYLVMELLQGQALAEELAALGSLPAARAARIGAQMADALDHAHAQGVVHRDLKPDNVFLVAGRGGDFVKVLDFGLVKLVEGDAGGTLTEMGTVFGTPEYMSPEQANGQPVTASSDIYAFGVVLYQMITGQLPFQAPTYVAILTLQISERPVPPSQRRPDLQLPAALDALVMQCLEKDPARRPAGAKAVAAALRGLAEVAARVPKGVAAHPTMDLSAVDAPAAAPPAAPTYTGPPSGAYDSLDDIPKRGRGWMLGVLLVVAMAAGGIWLALRGEDGKAGMAAAPDAMTPRAQIPARADAAPAVKPVVSAASSTPPPPPWVGGHISRPSDTAADHLRQAADFHSQGNHIKEIFHLQEAVRLEPRNRRANFLLGEALLADGHHDLGCQRLARALPDNDAQSLYDSSRCPTSH